MAWLRITDTYPGMVFQDAQDRWLQDAAVVDNPPMGGELAMRRVRRWRVGLPDRAGGYSSEGEGEML